MSLEDTIANKYNKEDFPKMFEDVKQKEAAMNVLSEVWSDLGEGTVIYNREAVVNLAIDAVENDGDLTWLGVCVLDTTQRFWGDNNQKKEKVVSAMCKQILKINERMGAKLSYTKREEDLSVLEAMLAAGENFLPSEAKESATRISKVLSWSLTKYKIGDCFSLTKLALGQEKKLEVVN